MSKHIHADLIIAWANGAVIQFYDWPTQQWVDADRPTWDGHIEYRVKPRGIGDLIAEAVAELMFLQTSNDPESAHSQADDILCELLTELGHESVVEEYSKISKWYA